MSTEPEVNMSTEPVCDFCSHRQVVCRYPARDFEVFAIRMGHIITDSIGDWAACAECRRLIEAGDSEALLNRSVRMFVERFGSAWPELVDELRRAHQGFFQHRCGLASEVARPPFCER